MSRSRKKHCFTTWCGGKSEKFSKACSARKFRAKVRKRMSNEDFDSLPKLMKEVYNQYNFWNDGTKHYAMRFYGHREQAEDLEVKEFKNSCLRK